MIYFICIIVSLFIGYALGVRVTLFVVKRRAIQIGSEMLLKSVQSILKPDRKG